MLGNVRFSCDFGNRAIGLSGPRLMLPLFDAMTVSRESIGCVRYCVNDEETPYIVTRNNTITTLEWLED